MAFHSMENNTHTDSDIYAHNHFALLRISANNNNNNKNYWIY